MVTFTICRTQRIDVSLFFLVPEKNEYAVVWSLLKFNAIPSYHSLNLMLLLVTATLLHIFVLRSCSYYLINNRIAEILSSQDKQNTPAITFHELETIKGRQ